VRAGSRELAEVRALRDSLRAAFTAGDENEAVGELNRVLRKSAGHLRGRAVLLRFRRPVEEQVASLLL
jgi:hypothetical protein